MKAGALSDVDREKLQNERKATVQELYKALANGNMETVTELLASDLDWWFHGPPKCQHMMRVLTGESSHVEFKFEPRSVDVIADHCVIAEGWEGERTYWVHVWTFKDDGVITKLREYFNTWIFVKEMRPLKDCDRENRILWQSHPNDLFDRSLPGIVLAI